MLILAWMFMAIAILATVVLLSDLREEIEYNNMNGSNEFALIITEGDHHGLQEADHRENRVVLRRCS